VSTTPAGNWLSPERVAHAEFRTGFRGLDATEVRAFLARVASELRSVLEREADLVARLEQAEARSTAIAAAPLDVKQVSELLGQETARVLETARAAAADIRAKAEAEATETREAAEAAAASLRTAAESVLAERTAVAEAEASEILAAANAEAARITTTAGDEAAAERQRAGDEAERVRAEARALLEQAEADGAAVREAARDEGRRMVAEARAVRERILTDMARRRNVARQQLERVRAARERLLEAIDEVRRNTAELHAGLSGSLVEAKLAGERGARTVDVDDIPTIRDLDAEVELAKDSGLIDVAALAARDDDLSVVDTGEFAAVTAPEPEVDRESGVAAEVQASAASVSAVPAGAPAAAAPTGPTGVLEPVASDVATTVEPGTEADGTAEDLDPVKPAEVAPAEVAPAEVDASPADATAAIATAATATAATAARIDAGAAIAGSGVVAEVTVGDETGPVSDAEPAAVAAGVGPTTEARPRPVKRTRGAKRTDELFARLKAADDPMLDSGAAAVVGAAAGDVPPPVPDPAGAASAATESAESAEGAGAAGAEEDETDVATGGADRVALHTRDALLAGTIRDLARQLKLALSDQQNQLLESGRDTSAARPLPVEEMVPPYVTASTEALAEAFSLGRRSVVPDDRAEADPAAIVAAATSLAEAVVDNLRQRFGSGADDEGLWTETRVRSVYREVRSQRLGDLVEFHVLSAYSAGQLAAASVGRRARWVSDTCGPDCLDNALAGSIAFGDAFPTGHQAPPAFPGCRCVLVVADTDSTD
jgi:DivIVA domain-containing protein